MEEQLIIELKEKYENKRKEIIDSINSGNNTCSDSYNQGKHYEISNIISALEQVLKNITYDL